MAERAAGKKERLQPVEFDDLYRDLILDHYRNPRNSGPLDGAGVVAEGVNPSCGDEIQVAIKLEDGRLAAVRFRGQGCSISQSSASMMTQETVGRSLDAVRALAETAQQLFTREDFDVDAVDIGDLEALQGVVRFPVRIKCALLAWKVLEQALAEETGETVQADSDIQTRIAAGGPAGKETA